MAVQIRLTKGIAGFWTGGWGGGPLVLISLGCLLTAGLAGGSLDTSLEYSLFSFVSLPRPASASDKAADRAPTFDPPEGAGGIAGLGLSGELLCGGCCGGCCGGGNRGASVFTCPLGVDPVKNTVDDIITSHWLYLLKFIFSLIIHF